MTDGRRLRPWYKGQEKSALKTRGHSAVVFEPQTPCSRPCCRKKRTVVTCGNYLLFRIQIPGFICLWGSKSNGKVETEKLWFCISTAPPIACFTICLRQDRVWEIETEKTKKCKVRLYNCTNECILRQHIRIFGAVMHHTFHMNLSCVFWGIHCWVNPTVWDTSWYTMGSILYTACTQWNKYLYILRAFYYWVNSTYILGDKAICYRVNTCMLKSTFLYTINFKSTVHWDKNPATNPPVRWLCFIVTLYS